MWNVNFVGKIPLNKGHGVRHIVAIEHVLNNCFNEQQLNSLEDYMYIQASVMLQFNEMIVILSEFLGFIFEA